MLLLLVVIVLVAVAAANALYARWQARHPERYGRAADPGEPAADPGEPAADGTDPPHVGWVWLRVLVSFGLLALSALAVNEMEKNGITVALVFACVLGFLYFLVAIADIPGDD